MLKKEILEFLPLPWDYSGRQTPLRPWSYQRKVNLFIKSCLLLFSRRETLYCRQNDGECENKRWYPAEGGWVWSHPRKGDSHHSSTAQHPDVGTATLSICWPPAPTRIASGLLYLAQYLAHVHNLALLSLTFKETHQAKSHTCTFTSCLWLTSVWTSKIQWGRFNLIRTHARAHPSRNMSKIWTSKLKLKKLGAHSNVSGIEPDFAYSFLIIFASFGKIL